MHSTCYRLSGVLFVLLCCWLATGATSSLHAQMNSVVNSTADDGDSYPYDDPNTEEFDEATDGICRNAAGRCTLRAALDEASGMGQYANVTFSVSGILTLGDRGTFTPPRRLHHCRIQF